MCRGFHTQVTSEQQIQSQPTGRRSLWGHTKDGAPGRSGSRSVACTQQAASRGHLGTPKAREKRPPQTDPAEGEGRRQRAVQGARRARKRRMESLTVELHSTHVSTHTLLKQLRQPSAKQCQPHPSGRRGRPRTHTLGGPDCFPPPKPRLGSSVWNSLSAQSQL